MAETESDSDDTAAQTGVPAAQARVDLLAAAQRYESEQAQKLVDEFVDKARQIDLPCVELRARTLDGHVVKTRVMGWYIKMDHSLAIGCDGKYYQLTVPGGFMARIRGVGLVPSPPSMTVGRGGKDGESGDLKDFLARALNSEVPQGRR